MNPSDQLAYQIGRTILDLHIARQTIAAKDQELDALRERVTELEQETQGVERTPNG